MKDMFQLLAATDGCQSVYEHKRSIPCHLNEFESESDEANPVKPLTVLLVRFIVHSMAPYMAQITESDIILYLILEVIMQS